MTSFCRYTIKKNPLKWSVLLWGAGVPPRPALPCPALLFLFCPATCCPALPCPALVCPPPTLPYLPCPCPALALPCPALPPGRVGVSTSSSPDRARGPGCLLETLACRRVAGTGREDPQPDTSPSQLRFAVNLGAYISNCERKQRARKPPLRGVWGVNPKPYLRIVGVVGAGLHADASAR